MKASSYNLGMTHKILIIEDDASLQRYLSDLLIDANYNVEVASDGLEGLNKIEKSQPDLVVLDLGLPKVSGETICLEIRKKYPQLRVIILTAKDSVSDIIHGLKLGADDYMTKPFVAEEFLARIEARLRRSGESQSKLTAADLELDTFSMEVKRDGKLIQLTPQEFKLLEYLLHNKGRVLTREMILNRVWMFTPDIETRVVDVYIGYLRKKIDAGYSKKIIQSVRGFGYLVKE